MNTLYVFPDGSKLYAPDRPIPVPMVQTLRQELMRAPALRGLQIMGEDVEVVDLRDPMPTVAVIEIPSGARK